MPHRAASALLLSLFSSAEAQSTLTFTAQWQTGLFEYGDDIGSLNPHVYRPEEFTVNDLVYEGLVAWDASDPGADGVNGTADDFVVGALAVDWTTNYAAVQANSATPYQITFNLRPGTQHEPAAAARSPQPPPALCSLLSSPLLSSPLLSSLTFLTSLPSLLLRSSLDRCDLPRR